MRAGDTMTRAERIEDRAKRWRLYFARLEEQSGTDAAIIIASMHVASVEIQRDELRQRARRRKVKP